MCRSPRSRSSRQDRGHTAGIPEHRDDDKHDEHNEHVDEDKHDEQVDDET